MRRALFSAAVSLIFILLSPIILAQTLGNENFPERKAYIINNCPFLELSGFSFINRYQNYRNALHTDLSWKNTGSKGITAFEVVVAYYDPFNRPLRQGGRWLVPGTNSADWRPLMPGKSATDGLIGYDAEYAFTAFAYVRTARLEDGTVWTFKEDEVIGKMRDQLPQIKDFSNVNPKDDSKDAEGKRDK